MKILAIETSCDETGISILELNEHGKTVSGKVLSHLVSSQVALHAPFGGVVPNIAKREHQIALVPLLHQALNEALLLTLQKEHPNKLEHAMVLEKILEREPELLTACLNFLPTIEIPEIDAITVTHGPGLEPALWVGVNFAKALATTWGKPLIPVSHMEGHLFSALLKKDIESTNPDFHLEPLAFPAVGLLVSGGHTELIKISGPLQYELLGQTRDDAVGEAFDKVARLLDLPYPGGPEISKLATQHDDTSSITLPRPMISSPDLDFSFSGLKTSVRYLIQKLPLPPNAEQKINIAHEFEEAVTEVIVSKTKKALEQNTAKILLVGGGVIANKRIRAGLIKMCAETGVTLHLPENWLTGDNATMIAVAGYFRWKNNEIILRDDFSSVKATGTLRLHA